LENQAELKDILVSSRDAGKRVDKFLSGSSLNLSRSFIQKLIDDVSVKVNGMPVRPSYVLKENDRISVSIPPPKKLDVRPENIPIKVVYEDSDVIVLDKPAGLVVHPAAGNFSGTLVNALMFHCEKLSSIGGVLRPGIVHRLDKNTSGLMVVAKSDAAHRSISEQMKKRSVKKTYAALVHKRVPQDEGTIDSRVGRNPVHRKKMSVIRDSKLKSREALSKYRVVERFKGYTLLDVEIMTGRTHQIRVHMASIGHPVVGDSVYGKKKNELGIARQLLHAKKLGFAHPVTGQYLEFESELPGDFERALSALRKNVPHYQP